MTHDETLMIMAVLKGAYPMFYRDMKRGEANAIVNLWSEMFFDEPYELVAASVKRLIASGDTNFPPSIGQVKEQIARLTNPDEATEADAWNIVHNAIKNSAWNSSKEFEKLPPELQRIVGSANQLRDWALMDSDALESVVASNFRKSYRTIATRQREFTKLPSSIQRISLELAEKMKLPELEGKNYEE